MNSSFDLKKRKTIKLSKQHCEIILKGEELAWIKCLEECAKHSWESPKRIAFRQVTLENGVTILQQKMVHMHWKDTCDVFTYCNVGFCEISYLEDQMKFYGVDFWVESFKMHYQLAIVDQNLPIRKVA